jgi:hypothetical protein
MDHSHKHFHNKMANLAKRQDISTDGGTVYSVVYVTAEPTFTGVIGGFTTFTDDTAASNTAAQTSVPLEFTTAPTETVVGEASTASTSTPGTTLLSSPTNFSNANTGADTSVAGAAATAGSSSGSSSSSSEGMSTVAKAGIAIGIIGAVGLFAIFLLWLLGKKKKERQALANRDNEKSGYGAGAAASTPPTEMLNRSPTSATAPRLSLRPVSRMLPEFMAPSKGRLSNGNLLNTIGEGPAQNRNLSPSPQPRGPSPSQLRPQENPFADPQNPFADPEKPVQAPAPLSLSSTVTKPTPLLPMAATIVPAAAATATATAAAVTAAPQMARVESPAPLRTPAPAPVMAPAPAPAPAPEPIAMRPAAPVSTPSTPVTPGLPVAAGSGPEPAQGNVYRVMMDFKPSMEDELELIVGQLVRLLHEYDDGWVSSKDRNQ